MKILLVQTGFLGDVLLSTPVISGLRMILPHAEISVLTTPQAKPFLESHPELHEVLVFDKRGSASGLRGLMRLSNELRTRDFSLVVSLHKSYRTAVLLMLSGIKRRLGFREAALWWTYTKTIRRKHLPHEVLRNLVILELLGARLADLPKQMSLHPGTAAEEEAAQLLSGFPDSKLIGIAPGSVWATKRWTDDGFCELSRLLSADGYSIVLLGGKEDKEISEKIARSSSGSVLNLAGACSLAVSAAIVKRLSVLVTNDSSPLHIASAMQTPVVSIFCATIPEFGFGPWEVPHRIIEVRDLRCRPCGSHGGRTCPTGTHACRTGVRAKSVRDAVGQLLEAEIS